VESELLGEDVSSQLGDNEEQDEVDPLRDHGRSGGVIMASILMDLD